MIIFIFPYSHIIFIIMIIILHRSELQSLANQTAYNVSQLLDNLLQVTIFPTQLGCFVGFYTIGGQGALELKDDFVFICLREKGVGRGLRGILE